MAANPRFTEFLAHMQELHNSKNHDYAEDDNPYSNFEFASRYAKVPVSTVFAVMIGIKQARLLALTGKTPNNESVWDTRRDLAMYAALDASYHAPVPTQKIDDSKLYQLGRLWCNHCNKMNTGTWEHGEPLLPLCPRCGDLLVRTNGDERFGPE